jgi:hypothetical protein
MNCFCIPDYFWQIDVCQLNCSAKNYSLSITGINSCSCAPNFSWNDTIL